MEKSHREISVNVVFLNILRTYLEVERSQRNETLEFDLQLTIFIFKVLSVNKLIRLNSPMRTQIPSIHELLGC